MKEEIKINGKIKIKTNKILKRIQFENEFTNKFQAIDYLAEYYEKRIYEKK